MKELNAPLDPDTRLKRLRMRAWRRGIKEMDLILGPYIDANGKGFSPQDMDILEELMNRNDQQLYAWISGAAAAPEDATPGEIRIVETLSSTNHRVR